jgi:tetratricopeptide (TPR) repeat protein
MHSIFRIGQLEQIDKNDRLWQLDLTLTSDNHPQLLSLTEYIGKETSFNYNGWDRLGMLLIKLGYFNRAEEVFEILVKQATYKTEKAYLFYQFGLVKDNKGESEEAITFFDKSCEINRKILSPTDPMLAASCSSIGLVYNHMGEYLKALSYYEKDLAICQKTLFPNDPCLAVSYNNIGYVYHEMHGYPKALSYYGKATEIREKLFLRIIPIRLLFTTNLEKALDIYQKALPANHPALAPIYEFIGMRPQIWENI